MAKLTMFNRTMTRGIVKRFAIRQFDSGFQCANITVRNTLDGNLTNLTLFGRDNLKYGDQDVTLQSLEKIFMASDGTPRNVLVQATGRATETVNGDKSYFNNNVYKIEPADDETKQYSTLAVQGIVENVKYSTTSDDRPFAKIKLGIMSMYSDGTVHGVDKVTVVAYDDVAEKLEDKDVTKGCQVSLRCDVVNKLGEVDRFGDRIGAPQKEIVVAKVTKVDYQEDLVDFEIYQKAKKLKKGEKFNYDDAYEELVDDELEDDDFDDELDF